MMKWVEKAKRKVRGWRLGIGAKFSLLAASVDPGREGLMQDAADGLRDQADFWNPSVDSPSWVFLAYGWIALFAGVVTLILPAPWGWLRTLYGVFAMGYAVMGCALFGFHLARANDQDTQAVSDK